MHFVQTKWRFFEPAQSCANVVFVSKPTRLRKKYLIQYQAARKLILRRVERFQIVEWTISEWSNENLKYMCYDSRNYITYISKLNTNKNLAGNIQEAKTRFPSVVGQRPASHRMGENTYVSFQTTLLSVLHSPPPHNENIIGFLPFCFLCLPF